jgi:hypothetical protein
MDFLFRNAHLQEVADKLWLQLSIYLVGTKKVSFGGGHYLTPFKTLCFGYVLTVKTVLNLL